MQHSPNSTRPARTDRRSASRKYLNLLSMQEITAHFRPSAHNLCIQALLLISEVRQNALIEIRLFDGSSKLTILHKHAAIACSDRGPDRTRTCMSLRVLRLS